MNNPDDKGLLLIAADSLPMRVFGQVCSFLFLPIHCYSLLSKYKFEDMHKLIKFENNEKTYQSNEACFRQKQ